MNTKQIHAALSSEKLVKDMNFLGVFPLDKIPMKKLKFPCCFVFNNKDHTNRGEHWLACVLTKDKKGIYFDSFGFPPTNLPEIGDVLNTCNEWTYNDTQLQNFYSTVCGEYVMFFITHMAKGFTMEHIIFLLNDSGDTFANDSFIFNYTKEKYKNVINTDNLKLIDLPFIFEQQAFQPRY